LQFSNLCAAFRFCRFMVSRADDDGLLTPTHAAGGVRDVVLRRARYRAKLSG